MPTHLVWAFLLASLCCGFALGVSYTKINIGHKHCASRGYQTYEVLQDWSIRCFTVLPADGGKP